MFAKILIANRGEIACRIIKTARSLGIKTVAVYSKADVRALHVAMADEAYLLGSAPVGESYLKGEAILQIAQRAGAEAIHPGYGFLSENAKFAEACEAEGLVFIGPPASAIRAMGEKDEAKRIMEKAGVPVVPGYHGSDQDPATLAKEAVRLGYPILIKAVAGGGGKGMRRVDDPAEFLNALEGAKREAKSAFGNDRVLIEKFMLKPRHIEFQVFADSNGNTVHLFERDCSLQRRHQKVIEEAPAPGMPEEMRQVMGKAAVSAAKAIGYRGAGTVEFIADVSDGLNPAHCYFMEMNTRLQVEHPVTEMITGLDLVEWQLRVASGEPLPIAKQKDIHANGHAVEVRLYAEDPAAGFLPATGTIRHLALPEVGENLRIDSGIRQGDAVTPHYDPMIAKVIAWGEDRATAILRLRAALDALELEGCTTNLSFLRNLLADSVFEAGAHDTGYIGRALEELTHEPPLDEDALAAAALFQLLPEKPSPRRADPYSPWSQCYGWRPWGGARQFVRISYGGEILEVAASFLRDGGMELQLPSGTVTLNIIGREGNLFRLDLGDRVVGCSVIRTGSDVRVFLKGRCYHFSLPDLHYGAEQEESGDDRIISPLPGRVVEMKARVGQKVAEGTPLAVLEAMKMEHTLKAPRDGTIAEVFASAGDQVDEGTVLLIFEEEAG